MSAQHTPGPWKAIRNGIGAAITIYGANDFPIATTCSNTSPITMQAHRDGTVAANAKLIAAAPNLLKTLQDIAEQLEAHPAYIKGATQEDMEEQGGEAADITWMAQLARSEIAKAVLP